MDDSPTPLVVLMDGPFDANALSIAGPLDVRNVGMTAWTTLLSHCRAESLRIYHITTQSIELISRLAMTKDLSLEWANKVTTLRPVFEMTWLSRLSVIDFPKVSDIDGIAALKGLVELSLSGNRGSLVPPLKINSIAPLTELRGLERFSLSVARLGDDDITPLASLSALRQLNLSNQFERTQFAYLAKRLNGQLENRIEASSATKLACQKCGSAKHMFTGRKQPILCRRCDAPRFDRLTDQFLALVAAA